VGVVKLGLLSEIRTGGEGSWGKERVGKGGRKSAFIGSRLSWEKEGQAGSEWSWGGLLQREKGRSWTTA